VIMGLFFILWAISGVVMNHRQLFSGLDISRNLLPKEHRYVNWNNAAVKSAATLGHDSLLIYGNIGVWLSDDSFPSFTDFNNGFPEGIDNRKILSLLVSSKGNIYAGTLFGLFFYSFQEQKWINLQLPLKDKRIQWLIEKDGKIILLTRSDMFEAQDDPDHFELKELMLPPPEGYDNKAGLFRTIWVIHSGEIYGITGKLIVDVLGIIVILLAITGALHFAMPYALRKLKKQKKSLKSVSATKRVSARWHKKAGIWIAIFLLINTITGMFLRPPLLITIANARIGKIPWSVLDTPNPWEDKLRALIFDEKLGGYLIGTNEGIFYADKSLSRKLVPLPGQPPLSVMGINVFQKIQDGKYLVGSFNGLFDWHLKRGGVPGGGVPGGGVPGDWVGVSFNHFSGQIPQNINAKSKPFSDEMVSGYWRSDSGKYICFDYNRGAFSSKGLSIPSMSVEILEKSPMSWWNFSLEVHTGRIFKPLLGDFYILIVPLLGIFGSIIVISGIVVWLKLYNRKKRSLHS